MVEIGAIVLHKLLKEKSLEGWSRLKLSFFNASYTTTYSAINKYYTKYNKIPGFNELNINSRDAGVKQNLAALEALEVPEDIDLDLAIDSLINEFTQDEALKGISKFVDKITLLDSEEVKKELNTLALNLDEKTFTSINVVTANNITIFEEVDNSQHNRIYTGLNNSFDANVGIYRGDLVLFGGKRGHGKSVTLCNLSANQFEQGNVVPYFTVEMKASEIFQRNLAILSDVSSKNIRNNTLSEEEVLKLAKTRSTMFDSGEIEYEKFLRHKDRFLFENNLIKNCTLKPENQLIIIHDPSLTLTSVDIHLQKLKAKFGDKLKLAVVDYINQIVIDGKFDDRYDWRLQIEITAKLKEFASKYDIAMASAYQIDKDNEARFSKGILDSPDLSYILNANSRVDGILTFENTKTRSSEPMDFNCPINWDTLKISPLDAVFSKKTKKVKTEDEAELPF